MANRTLQILCVAILSIPATLHADPAYFSVHGALILADDYTVETENQSNSATFSVTTGSSEMGFRGGVALGKRAGFAKFEVEYAFRSFGFDGVSLSNGNGDSRVGSDGSVTTNSLMGNFAGFMPLGIDSNTAVGLLFGGGIGIAQLKVDDMDTSNATVTKRLSDTSVVGAYQLFGGVEFVGDELAVAIQYRLFLSESADLTDSGGQSITADGLASNEILISVDFLMN